MIKESPLHELFDRTTEDIDSKLSGMGVGGRQRSLDNLLVPGIFFERNQLTAQVSRDLGLPENLSVIFVKDPDQPDGPNSVVVEIRRDFLPERGDPYESIYNRWASKPRYSPRVEVNRLYLTVHPMPKLHRPLVLPLPRQARNGSGLIAVEDGDIREPAVFFADGNFPLGTDLSYSDKEDVMLLISKPESEGEEVMVGSVQLQKDWKKLVTGGRFMERHQIPVQQEQVQSTEESDLEQLLLNSPRKALEEMKAMVSEFPDPPNLKSRDGAKIGRFGRRGRARIFPDDKGFFGIMLENLQVRELAEQCYRGTLQPTILEKCLYQTTEGDGHDQLVFKVGSLFGASTVEVGVVRWDMGKKDYVDSKPYIAKLVQQPNFNFDDFSRVLQAKLGTAGALAHVFNKIKPIEFRLGPKAADMANPQKVYGDRPDLLRSREPRMDRPRIMTARDLWWL